MEERAAFLSVFCFQNPAQRKRKYRPYPQPPVHQLPIPFSMRKKKKKKRASPSPPTRCPGGRKTIGIEGSRALLLRLDVEGEKRKKKRGGGRHHLLYVVFAIGGRTSARRGSPLTRHGLLHDAKKRIPTCSTEGGRRLA